MILENNTDIATDVRYATVADVAEIDAIENNLASTGSLNQCYQFQHRAFARAGMPGEIGHAATRQPKIDPADGFVPAGVTFADIIEMNHIKNQLVVSSE